MLATAVTGYNHWPVELHLFGSPRLFVGRREFQFRRRQPVAILSVLALNDRPVTRDEVSYLLWPDVAQEVARQRLRRSLSELRRTIGPLAAQILPDSTSLASNLLRLNVEMCRVDAREFLQLSNQAQNLPDPDGLHAAQQAAEIGAAPLLKGLELDDAPEFEHWLRQQRERFEHLQIDVLRRLVKGYVSLQDYPRAIAAVEQALRLDALSEDLHRKAMWLYAAIGRRSDAIRQFAWCTALLERELAIEPDTLTRALHQAILEERVDEARRLAFRPETERSTAPSSPTVSLLKKGESSSALPSLSSLPRLAKDSSALLDNIAGAIRQALDGVPQVIWVQGPAGAGKNALVYEALLAIQRTQPEVEVWSVSARRAIHGAPFELMQHVLNAALRKRLDQPTAVSPDVALPAGLWMAEAVRLLPELRAKFLHLQPPDVRDVVDTTTQSVLRRRLLQALPQALHALTAGRAVVAVLNDLESADPLSIEAVDWLARTLAGAKLALVITCRQIGPTHSTPLSDLLDKLRAHNAVSVWTLPPLDQSAVAELMRQLNLPVTLAGPIWQHAGGAPRFVLEMARAAVTVSKAGQPVAPVSLREAIQINLRALDPVTRQVLETAAVLGGDTLHWLHHVSGRDPDEIERACQTLLEWDWLAQAGDEYVIASPELREAVLDSLSPTRRRRLHAQAAVLLRQHNADAHTIAYHLEAAGQSDDAASAWLHAARRARELYAGDAALSALQRGLALTNNPSLQFELLCEQENILHENGRREQQAITLASLQRLADAAPDHSEWQAEVYRRRGRYALARNAWSEAVEMLQRAAACTLHNDDEILLLLTRALGHSRRWGEAEATLQRALALAERRSDTAAQARCRLVQAEMAQWREEYDAAHTALNQAIEVAGPRSPLLPHLMLMMGNLTSLRNDFAGALTYGQEALRLFARHGAPDGEAAAQVLIARMCARLGRLEEALAAYEAAYAGYAALDLRQGMAAARVNASTLALRAGDFEHGVALARDAYDLFQSIQDARGLCVAASNLGAAMVWMGQGQQAERWLRESYERAVALNLLAQQAAALANLGAAVLQQDRAAEARSLMEQGLALRTAQGHLDVSIDRAFLAIACLRMGDLPAADAYSAQAVADVQRMPQVENPQQVWFARAQVLHALGRSEEARAALLEAVAHLRRIEHVLPRLQRQRYLSAFPFNRAILRAEAESVWPDPASLV